jgi:broad specificity phosphatase PhoE
VTGEGGVLKRPSSWPLYRNPLRPSWGEPYEQVAKRMLAAVLKARDEAAGHEAVCVSHQLPIVCLRRYLEQRRLWHDPRRRQCSLASITSVVFDGAEVLRIDYAEPSGTTPNQVGWDTQSAP